MKPTVLNKQTGLKVLLLLVMATNFSWKPIFQKMGSASLSSAASAEMKTVVNPTTGKVNKVEDGTFKACHGLMEFREETNGINSKGQRVKRAYAVKISGDGKLESDTCKDCLENTEYGQNVLTDKAIDSITEEGLQTKVMEETIRQCQALAAQTAKQETVADRKDDGDDDKTPGLCQDDSDDSSQQMACLAGALKKLKHGKEYKNDAEAIVRQMQELTKETIETLATDFKTGDRDSVADGKKLANKMIADLRLATRGVHIDSDKITRMISQLLTMVAGADVVKEFADWKSQVKAIHKEYADDYKEFCRDRNGRCSVAEFARTDEAQDIREQLNEIHDTAATDDLLGKFNDLNENAHLAKKDIGFVNNAVNSLEKDFKTFDNPNAKLSDSPADSSGDGDVPADLAQIRAKSGGAFSRDAGGVLLGPNGGNQSLNPTLNGRNAMMIPNNGRNPVMNNSQWGPQTNVFPQQGNSVMYPQNNGNFFAQQNQSYFGAPTSSYMGQQGFGQQSFAQPGFQQMGGGFNNQPNMNFGLGGGMQQQGSFYNSPQYGFSGQSNSNGFFAAGNFSQNYPPPGVRTQQYNPMMPMAGVAANPFQTSAPYANTASNPVR
jgi:hypothetical protein